MAIAENHVALPGGARWLAPLEVVLVMAVFTLRAGWPPPDVNEPHYLGKARHFWNAAWASGDFFLESEDAHFVFYLACGWPTRWLSLAAFAWLGRLFTWLLLATAWQRLCQAIVGRSGWAVFSAALFLTFHVGCHLAGEWVVGGFEAKGLAYALVFFALAAYTRGRWNIAFLLLGGASAFHVLVGGWSAIALGLCWLASRDAPPLTRMLPGLIGGGLLALPGVIPALALNGGAEPQIVAEANDIYVFRRLPHHLVPNAFRWPSIAQYLAMLFVWLLISWRPHDNERLRRLISFVVATLAISLAGIVLAQITLNHEQMRAAILRYYWFRLGDVLPPVGIGLAAAAKLAEARVATNAPPRKFWLAIAAWSAVGVALVVYARGEYAAWNGFADVPRADKSGKVLRHDDWRDVCQWIADHAPPTTLAVTPRMAQTFTWHSGHGQVVSWKDLPQNAEAVVRWWQRLEDIYGRSYGEFRGRWHESLTELPPARLRQLGQRYGAAYLVVEADPPIALPCLYRNGSYAVYRLMSERP